MRKKKRWISIISAFVCSVIIFVIVITTTGIYDYWRYGKGFFTNNDNYRLITYTYDKVLEIDIDLENFEKYEYNDFFKLKIHYCKKEDKTLTVYFEIESKLSFFNSRVVKANSDVPNYEKYLILTAVMDNGLFELKRRSEEFPKKNSVAYRYNLNCDDIITCEKVILVFKDLVVNDYIRN